jgi:hypothetical protein
LELTLSLNVRDIVGHEQVKPETQLHISIHRL